MKTIAVVCEKDCTGKSVIATELYESYVRQGLSLSAFFRLAADEYIANHDW